MITHITKPSLACLFSPSHKKKTLKIILSSSNLILNLYLKGFYQIEEKVQLIGITARLEAS